LRLAVDEEKTIRLPVKNTTDKPQSYTSNIDLHGATGPEKFSIAYANSSDFYLLTIKPTLGGIYAGCVTLTDDDGKYIWYTFEMESHGQKQRKQMEVFSHVRKVSVSEIDLVNPLNETIKYAVTINGEGLDGNPDITLEPHGSAKYELYFFPLRLYSADGSVSFSNPRIGEIFYEVKTASEDQPAVKLPIMKAELGKNITRYIQLDNPLAVPVSVTYRISRPEIFDI
jgi:hypothetical protein